MATLPFAQRLKRLFAGAAAASLAAEDLLAEACRRAGLSDYGDDAFRAGLGALLRSAEEDAALHDRGRAALREAVVSALVVRLRLVDALARDGALAEGPIRRPIFVVGLPRTGTTLLHRLLTLDDGALYLPLWLCLQPLPPPSDDEWRGADTPRRASARALVEAARRRDPQLFAMHEIGADLPEEDSQILQHTFATWQFGLTTPVYGYLQWVQAADRARSYRELKALLRLLERGLSGTQWVLKAPEHAGSLATLLEVFPEADVVWTHRAPSDVVASWCSLMTHLYRQRSDRVDPRTVGARHLALLSDAAARAASVAEGPAGARVHHVSYRSLVEDPAGVLRSIHGRFDRPAAADLEQRVARFLEENPRGKHGAHRYALEDFGLSKDEVDRRFAAYLEAAARRGW